MIHRKHVETVEFVPIMVTCDVCQAIAQHSLSLTIAPYANLTFKTRQETLKYDLCYQCHEKVEKFLESLGGEPERCPS